MFNFSTPATSASMARGAHFGRWMRVLAISLAALVVISACSSTNKKEEVPAKLVDFKAQLSVSRAWRAALGTDGQYLRVALRVAVADGVAYAGGYGGDAIAVKVANGSKRWRVKTKLQLSAGPGVGQASDGTTIVVFGTVDGTLLALNATNGKERWRHRVSGEVLSTPVVTEGEVIVRSVDGHVLALSADDATVLWNYDQSVPKLSLRGNASPVVAGTSVLVAFDNGRVASLDIKTGEIQWDTAVGTPDGRSELARMVDVDGPVSVSGDDLFVASYQSRIAMLARDSGQIWWARDFSSYRGLAVDASSLYATNAHGEVVGMRRSDGTVTWEQKALQVRGLSAPAIDNQALIVGDYQGYVHWLSVSDGALLARMKTDGGRISAAPLVTDGLVLVQTEKGSVVAFKVKEKKTQAKK